MMNIPELQNRLLEINQAAQILRAKAADEKRDLTVDEAKQLESLLDEFDRVEERIGQLTKLDSQSEKLSKPTGRKTQSDQPIEVTGDNAGNVTLTKPSGDRRIPAEVIRPAPSNWNFQSLGDFALDVRRACVKGGQMTNRLALSEKLAAATTYGSESSGTDGGFAVPPDFRTAIMTTITGEDSLLSRCDMVTVNGNSFTCPVDENSPWDTTNGIQANWDGEAATAAQSKPQLKERTTKLNKLRALVPMTEEILEDASAMDAYLRRKAPEKIGFKLNLAIVQGTGVGQPLGFQTSPALVTVTKESGQVANTIVANNIFKMYNRMHAPLRPTAIWLINPEVEPQLYKLSVPGTDNTGNSVTGWGGLVYMPPGGISASPYGTLMGRPVISTQACPALSSAGDINFVNLSQYLALLKGGQNPRVEVSMHLWFDQDLMCFKFVLRVGGVTWWSQALSPYAGSNTYSPYVALGAR